jgi:hypothetical protein
MRTLPFLWANGFGDGQTSSRNDHEQTYRHDFVGA